MRDGADLLLHKQKDGTAQWIFGGIAFMVGSVKWAWKR
ncbi:hypothetical protein GGR08_000589 [Bartonella fuyuanensis]|uniref:Uncharacterized protein n=1 Tax=Bartonella fuyuanensis TaxID=1460968 RepID=A0A840E568_9HYPH|nr:hypothetical protein [Bartonella fuyuanensis]